MNLGLSKKYDAKKFKKTIDKSISMLSKAGSGCLTKLPKKAEAGYGSNAGGGSGYGL